MVQPNRLPWNLEGDILWISNNKREHRVNFKWELIAFERMGKIPKTVESNRHSGVGSEGTKDWEILLVSVLDPIVSLLHTTLEVWGLLWSLHIFLLSPDDFVKQQSDIYGLVFSTFMFWALNAPEGGSMCCLTLYVQHLAQNLLQSR